MTPSLPSPRGPLSEFLIHSLAGGARPIWGFPNEVDRIPADDLQISLHLCFGLHYDGFQGVDEKWEWEPSLISLRNRLEQRFLTDLVAGVPGAARPGNGQPHPLAQLEQLLAAGGKGPSLSQFMAEQGTLDQFREFVIHRSIYQRKEADAHTWAIPRLRGRAKSAIVTLQSDEYGNGVRGRSHSELFAKTMVAVELDPTPGAYIDQVPAVTLATDNLVTLLGLHRRWRGALVGHLAVFEMTSVEPMARYAAALRRMGVPEDGIEFYDVHVEADVAHARIAATDLIGGLVESDPDGVRDIVFGAASLLEVESHFSHHLLRSWAAGLQSLRFAGGSMQCPEFDTTPLVALPSPGVGDANAIPQRPTDFPAVPSPSAV